VCECSGFIPLREMNVKVDLFTEVGNLHYRPTMILRVKGLSVSIHVGTRKMVNYA
jgi:hypothetical protein